MKYTIKFHIMMLSINPFFFFTFLNCSLLSYCPLLPQQAIIKDITFYDKMFSVLPNYINNNGLLSCSSLLAQAVD